MASWLAACAQFLGHILKMILPDIIAEFKKPSTTIQIGNDEELKKDIDNSIEDEILNDENN